MNKTRSFRRLSVLVLAVLLMTSTILCGTFAKYTTSQNLSGTTNAATWSVEVNDTATTTEAMTLTLSPDAASNVKSPILAPGTTGSFAIKVANKGQVNLSYTVTFEVTGDFADNANIVFYTDSANKSTSTLTASEGKYTTAAETLVYETGSATTTIYWSWEWDDTTVENDYAGKTFAISAVVDAVQVQPQ